MSEIDHATQAQALISIIAILIPLLIWAFRDAEGRLTEARAHLRKRLDDKH